LLSIILEHLNCLSLSARQPFFYFFGLFLYFLHCFVEDSRLTNSRKQQPNRKYTNNKSFHILNLLACRLFQLERALLYQTSQCWVTVFTHK